MPGDAREIAAFSAIDSLMFVPRYGHLEKVRVLVRPSPGAADVGAGLDTKNHHRPDKCNLRATL